MMRRAYAMLDLAYVLLGLGGFAALVGYAALAARL
jgi:hypothetical protein